MSIIKRVFHGIIVVPLKPLTVLMVVSFLVCVILMLIEVIFRYVLTVQIYGLEELASAISVWLYFTAAAYATYEGTHLKAQVTHLFLKNPRVQARWNMATSIITLGLACYVLTWSYDYFIWGLTKGEYLRIGGVVGSFPSVYSHSALFLGFNLVVIYFILEAVKNLRAAFQKEYPV